MYEELIEELRRPHADCDPWALMDQAADAIHQLSYHADAWEKNANGWRERYEELERQRREES